SFDIADAEGFAFPGRRGGRTEAWAPVLAWGKGVFPAGLLQIERKDVVGARFLVLSPRCSTAEDEETLESGRVPEGRLGARAEDGGVVEAAPAVGFLSGGGSWNGEEAEDQEAAHLMAFVYSQAENPSIPSRINSVLSLSISRASSGSKLASGQANG